MDAKYLGSEPAYPVPEKFAHGMTKREVFAMAALAVVGSSHPQAPSNPAEAASYVVSVADALLAELAKEQP